VSACFLKARPDFLEETLSRGDPHVSIRILRALRIIEQSRDLSVDLVLARLRCALVGRE